MQSSTLEYKWYFSKMDKLKFPPSNHCRRCNLQFVHHMVVIRCLETAGSKYDSCHYKQENFNIALVLCQHYGISNQKLTGAISKENINALHCWPFVKRIHRRPMDSPHKEPLMQKASPCHDVITYSQFVLYFSNFSPENKKNIWNINQNH